MIWKKNPLLSIISIFSLAALLLITALLTLTYPTLASKQSYKTKPLNTVANNTYLITATTPTSKALPTPTVIPLPSNKVFAVPNQLTLMTEDFEATWPPSNGRWVVYGDPTFDDTSFNYYLGSNGSWSAWCADGGSLAPDPWQNDSYLNNMNARMIYGPLDLSGLTNPKVRFYLWNQSEIYEDWVTWQVSINGTNFYGQKLSGNTNGWKLKEFDLTDVHVLGDISGEPAVWLRFGFTSNDVITGQGAYIDDIAWVEPGAGLSPLFNPNPIATSGDTTLTDSNNLNDPRLVNEQEWVQLQGLTRTGYLQGEYVNLVDGGDFSSCDTGKARGQAFEITSVFSYTRDDDRFEEAMVYHHIDTYQRYIQSLGFTDILTRPVFIHAHCYQDDNSRSSDQIRIGFGDGGVDDAEDGEVIIHEYGHLILFDQIRVPTVTFKPEFDAIHEGFGDYLAASFFADQTISADLQACFAEWDAVNFQGYTPYSNPACIRRVDNNKQYPRDMIFIPHFDGEIYSGALWDIRSLLGQTTTDILVLKSLNYLEFNDGFGEAGDALIEADLRENQGSNIFNMALIFKNRGFFDPYEWNNTPDRATIIVPDVPSQTHSFYSKYDVDWLEFEVKSFINDSPAAYKIQTGRLQTDTDTIINLYDTDGATFLRSNDDCTSRQLSSCLTWHPSTTGTYYLKVMQYSPTISNTGITFTYDIKISTLILSESIYIPFILK